MIHPSDLNWQFETVELEPVSIPARYPSRDEQPGTNPRWREDDELINLAAAQTAAHQDCRRALVRYGISTRRQVGLVSMVGSLHQAVRLVAWLLRAHRSLERSYVPDGRDKVDHTVDDALAYDAHLRAVTTLANLLAGLVDQPQLPPDAIQARFLSELPWVPRFPAATTKAELNAFITATRMLQAIFARTGTFWCRYCTDPGLLRALRGRVRRWPR